MNAAKHLSASQVCCSPHGCSTCIHTPPSKCACETEGVSSLVVCASCQEASDLLIFVSHPNAAFTADDHNAPGSTFAFADWGLCASQPGAWLGRPGRPAPAVGAVFHWRCQWQPEWAPAASVSTRGSSSVREPQPESESRPPAGRRPVRSVPLAPAGGAPRIQGGVCHEAGLHVVQGRGTKAGFSKVASLNLKVPYFKLRIPFAECGQKGVV